MSRKLLRDVLVIEDNLGDVGLLRAMFQEQIPNNTVLTHVDCMSMAEEYLATQTADIILLDLGLPDAQGMEAVRRARAIAPRIPLVVLTGSDDESLALMALKEGAQEYLMKGELETRGLLRALRYATERKILEDALFLEMERAQVTLNSIGDAVICTDNSGNITFFNLVAENLTGWSQLAAVGHRVTSILRPLDAKNRYAISDPMTVDAAGYGAVIRTANSVLIRHDGAEVMIEDCISPIHDREGHVSGAIIVLRDVTERIKAQREIVESKRIFEDIFDNSDAAIIDYDFSLLFLTLQELQADDVADLRGYIAGSDVRLNELVDAVRINNANEAAFRMLGVSSVQELGKQSKNIIDIAEAMLQRQTRMRGSEYLVADGVPIPIVYSLRIPKTAEEARRVPMIIMDLSDIKLAEAARQATVAKSQFLSSMSHEIRTPLNGVIGNLELLALTTLDNEQYELIDDADKAAKALLGLVGNILDFSKIEADKLTIEMGDVNPAALVEEAVAVVQSLGRQKKIFVASTFGPDVPSLVRGDVMRIRQILLNLIGNAVKFTDQGGVEVMVMATEWDQDICELRFEVNDSGRGFDQSVADTLFKPFTQDRMPIDGTEGTGLGLSICKSLVEAFGGTIGCDGAPGEGSTFWFCLPVVVVRRALPPNRPDLTGITVMIIGSGNGAGKMLRDYFLERGATVVNEDYENAIAVARERGAEKASTVDIAVIVPKGGEDISEIAGWLRDQHILPLLYGIGQLPRTRLRQGFATVIPPVASADFLDRNIRLLMGHAQPRDRLAAQQAAVVSAFGLDLIGKQILVLEDRLVNQTVIQKQLQKLGIDCSLAANGIKGLEILDRRKFDLILCDCSMPEMNGYDFTRALRAREAGEQNGRRVPVIALTANAFGEDAEKCIESGMDDFISKPVTMDRLAAMLVRWLSPVVDKSTVEDESQVGATRPTHAIDMAGLADILGTSESETLNEVLAEFLVAARVSLAQVEGAVSSGSPDDIAAAVHGAKGEARSAAANSLAGLYTDLERMTKDGDSAGSRKLVVRSAVEVRRIEDFIHGRLADPLL